MKAGLAGAIAGISIGVFAALGGSALIASCTIDRPSESLKCYGQADCSPGRICEGGYCIVGTLPIDARELDAAVCPSTCNGGCDFTTSTCSMTGTGGAVTCPKGWNCTIGCPIAGACSAINCGMAASCKINCVAGNACGDVTCASANCDVTCTGVDACGNVSCTTGNCTETCSGGNGSAVCGALACTTGTCARTCTGASACGQLDCNGGVCTEICSGGSNACGQANCGTGKCTATCMGSDGACGDVHCAASCQCDVNCDLTTNICPLNMQCPDPPGGSTPECQDAFGTCDSSTTPNKCQKCP